MKKTLVGLAAAAAMCSASAASVTLYGIIDTGFAYNSYNDDNYSTLTDNADNSFGMMSGQSSGSRFGLKGALYAQGFGRTRQRHEGRFHPRKRL